MSAQARSPSRITLALLVVLGLINLVRGSLHAFLPDSGAGVIAHFDLARRAAGRSFSCWPWSAPDRSLPGWSSGWSSPAFEPWRRRSWRSNCCAPCWPVYIAFVSKSVGAGYPGAKGIAISAVVLTVAVIWEVARPRPKA
jgi:hypothetical protein